MGDAKTRYYTNSLMGDAPHEVLPEAREYIRELEAEVRDITQLLELRDRDIERFQKGTVALVNEMAELKAEVERLTADPRLALTIGDLRLLLTWAPSRSPEAARLRAALAGEGDEDE